VSIYHFKHSPDVPGETKKQRMVRIGRELDEALKAHPPVNTGELIDDSSPCGYTCAWCGRHGITTWNDIVKNGCRCAICVTGKSPTEYFCTGMIIDTENGGFMRDSNGHIMYCQKRDARPRDIGGILCDECYARDYSDGDA